MVQFHCRPSLFTNFAKMTKNLEKLEHWLGSFFFFLGGGGYFPSGWLVGGAWKLSERFTIMVIFLKLWHFKMFHSFIDRSLP